MPFGRRISIAMLALIYVPAAHSCSMAGCLNDGDEMRPTFEILVKHEDRPLAGVSFHVVANGAEQFSGITDESGSIHVPTLSPGLYWLKGEILGTGVVETCFHVGGKPSRKAKTQLIYTWGDEAPATSRIAGRLVDSQPAKGGTPIWNVTHRIDVPIAGSGLTVRDPLTNALYLTTSDKDGYFSFEGLPDGTYVLHIDASNADDHTFDSTDSVVQLDTSAKRSKLLFKRGPSGCGATVLALDLFN